MKTLGNLLWLILGGLVISLLIASGAAQTGPVQRNADGSVTVNTTSLKTVEGYYGPTPLLIHIDKNGLVSGIEFLPNDETLSYWQPVVSKLRNAWNGTSAEKVKDLKVDSVTGSTFSSESVISNVREGVRVYLETQNP